VVAEVMIHQDLGLRNPSDSKFWTPFSDKLQGHHLPFISP
jgi:hypothetical protein